MANRALDKVYPEGKFVAIYYFTVRFARVKPSPLTVCQSRIRSEICDSRNTVRDFGRLTGLSVRSIFSDVRMGQAC